MLNIGIPTSNPLITSSPPDSHSRWIRIHRGSQKKVRTLFAVVAATQHQHQHDQGNALRRTKIHISFVERSIFHPCHAVNSCFMLRATSIKKNVPNRIPVIKHRSLCSNQHKPQSEIAAQPNPTTTFPPLATAVPCGPSVIKANGYMNATMPKKGFRQPCSQDWNKAQPV